MPFIFTTERLFNIVHKNWLHECKTNREPLFGRALWNSFKYEFLFSAIAFMPYIVVVLLQPFFVQHLLQYITTGQTSFMYITSGMGLAILLGFISILSTVSFSHSFMLTSRCGLFIRGAVTGAIFCKSLKLSSASRGSHTMGEIVTLMAADVERIWLGIVIIHWIWAGPIMVNC